MALGKLGKYQKLDVLGSGGYGIVYLAEDTFLNRKVALKEIEVRHRVNFNQCLQEALIQATLSHPNIVTIHNAGEEGGRLFIDMELLDTDLAKVLKKERTLPAERAVNIALQILEGLTEADSKHVVHRDIKPNNILFSQTNIVKVGDFGKAHTLATGEYINGAGIPDYMAPETLMSEAKCDYRSDIWSVGVVFYEMLTGHLPFAISHSIERITRRQMLQQLKPPALKTYCSYNTEYLQPVINRALQSDKHYRYTSAQEFINVLRQIAEQPIPTISHSFADGLTLEVIQRSWPRIIRMVEKMSPAGGSYLQKASISGLEGNTILITFREAFARDRIQNKAKERDRIQNKAKELVEKKINEGLKTEGYRIQCLLSTSS